jgi:hypothetical protein
MSTKTGGSTERPDAYEEEEFRPRIRPWWVPWLVALVVAGLVIAVGSYFAYGRDVDVASMGMGGDEQVVPPVKGLYAGEEIHFIHTEASDPQVAGMLSEMMGSPVIVVRSLADVPSSALGNVFVFANGVQPDDEMERGPLGFQPDVFDTVPGEPGYSPLRAVNIVTWQDEGKARVLRSAEELEEAEAAGEVTVERPGAVVNMPIVEWPGGER